MKATNVKAILSMFFACCILAAGFVILVTKSNKINSVTAQSNKDPKQKNRSPENNFGFTEEVPSGDWSAQSEMDLYQSADPAVPVVIAGITSYAGKGRWSKHVMIESVVLKNRSYKAAKTIKFGWILITDSNRMMYKNREASLAAGSTVSFDTELPAFGMKRLEGLYLDVVKEAKALIKAKSPGREILSSAPGN